MTTALVLSGGGARGSFEVGVIKCLYIHFGVYPDLLATTSVGSINGVKLAEARVGVAADHLLALQQLEQIWYRLEINDDMYLPAPWLATLLTAPVSGPAIRAAMAGEGGADVDPGSSLLESPLAVHLALLLAALVAPGEIATAVRGTREPSLFRLDPIDMKLRDPANLDQSKVARGIPITMAVTSLESGALRYVRGDGQFVERDGRTPVASAIPATIGRCQSQADAFATLLDEVSQRRAERATSTSPVRRRQLDRELRSLRARAENAFKALQSCLISPGPAVPATVDLIDGVIASASMPAVFPPVRLGLENYVDGGVLEIVPVTIALKQGATEVYAVLASSMSLPKTMSFARKGFLSILEQALVEVTLKEVARDDLAPSNPRGIPIHVIAPSFDVHGTTEIEPGLIAIAKDYGYLCAGDVVTATPGFDRARSALLSDGITMLRRDTWELESTFSEPPDPGLRHAYLEELRLRKWILKILVATRRALSAPTPPNAFQWHAHWERHSSSDPAIVIPDPWSKLVSLSGTPTEAESPATYLPDGWLLREIGADQLHQLLKGATFVLAGPDEAAGVGLASAATVELPDHTVADLPKVPAGDTLLREADSPVVWYCDGRYRYGSLTPQIIAALGLTGSPVRFVPHGGLAQIPAGGSLFWVGGLVVTDSTATPLRAWQPTPQREGSSSSTECYLYNRTLLPITVSQLAIVGDSTGAFTVNTATPLVVYPGNRETVRVTFHPTQAGPILATLSVDCDDPTVPQLWVPVVTSATPIGPHGRLTVSPTMLAFPDTALGHPSAGELVVENIGDADAAITEIALIDETPSQQFVVPVVMPPPIPSTTLQPLALIGFAPNQRGTAQATAVLRVSGGSGYVESHHVKLTGRGIAPVIALNPEVLDFSDVAPGQLKSLALDVANDGDDTLTLSGIFTVQGRSGSFLFQPVPSLPALIAPGATETIQITYASSEPPGTVDETVYEFVSDDPFKPRVRLTVRGTVAGSRIEVRPDFVDFATVNVTPAVQTVTVHNGGSTSVAVNEVMLESGRSFRLVGLPMRPFTVPAGGQQGFQLEFTAKAYGHYVDRVVVLSDDHRRPVIRNTVEATLL